MGRCAEEYERISGFKVCLNSFTASNGDDVQRMRNRVAHRLLHDKFLQSEYEITPEVDHYTDKDIKECIHHLEDVWDEIVRQAQNLYRYPEWTYHGESIQGT
jgi:hypothetical protein